MNRQRIRQKSRAPIKKIDTPWKDGSLEEKPKKRMGRKPKRPILKPNLFIVVEVCGGLIKLSKELGISAGRISNWLYRDIDIPIFYRKSMSRLLSGIITAKEINEHA